MNRKDRHLITLISVTLLLLVVLVGIALFKGTFDLQAWTKGWKFKVPKVVKQMDIPATSYNLEALKSLKDVVSSSSEYAAYTDELEVLNGDVSSYTFDMLPYQLDFSGEGGVTGTIEALIVITEAVKTTYERAFELVSVSPPTENPYGSSAEEETGSLEVKDSKFLQLNIDRLKEIKAEYESIAEGYGEVVLVGEEMVTAKTAFEDMLAVLEDIVTVMEKVQEECGSIGGASAEDEIDVKKVVCYMAALPIQQDLATVLELLVAAKAAYEDGSEEAYLAFIAQAMEVLEVESLEDFVNLLLSALETVEEGDPYYEELTTLYNDLLKLQEDFVELQGQYEEAMEYLYPLLSYLYLPWQQNVVAGAMGQTAVHYVDTSTEKMLQINVGVLKVLGVSKNDTAKKIVAQLNQINKQIANVQAQSDALKPKVNLHVRVVEKDGFTPFTFEEKLALVVATLAKLQQAAEPVSYVDLGEPEVPDMSDPNEAIKTEGYRAIDVDKDILEMLDTYLTVWQGYVQVAKEVKVLLDEMQK